MAVNKARIALFSATAALAVAAGPVPAGAAFRPLPGSERRTEGATSPPAPRRALPYSHGRTFATLDEYLAHLRLRAGPIGQPWYREVRRGVFERVTTVVPPPPRRTYSRAQLMAMFGFKR